jgi:hypothetical protein
LQIFFNYIKEDGRELCSSSTVLTQYIGTSCVDYAFMTAQETFGISSNRKVTLSNKGIATLDLQQKNSCQEEVS